MMAATLFCHRLLSRRRPYRSLCHQAPQMGVSCDQVVSRPLPSTISNEEAKVLSDQDLIKDEYDGPSLHYRPVIFEGRNESRRSINIDEELIRRDNSDKEYFQKLNHMSVSWRVVELDQSWDMVVYNRDPPTILTCIYHLKQFLRIPPRDQMARPFIAFMMKLGTIPDLSIFSLVIKPYCKHLTYQQVLDVVFTQMKAVGVRADGFFYKRLMDGVCAHFGAILGYELLKQLRSNHRIQMSLSCYNVIVRLLCRRKMIEDVKMVLVLIDVLMDMKEHRIFLDEKIYIHLKKGHCTHGGEACLKAVGIGRQMFAKGIRVRALSPTYQDAL